MLLVSDWPLTLHGVLHLPGVPFDEPDDKVAADLIQRDVARKSEPPRVLYDSHRDRKPKTYETKPAVFETPEVVPESPFRDSAAIQGMAGDGKEEQQQPVKTARKRKDKAS